MCFCEDGPGRKTGLPTWGRMGQVRLGLWKEKKRLWGGVQKQREKPTPYWKFRERKAPGASRGQCRGKQLKSDKTDDQRGLSP